MPTLNPAATSFPKDEIKILLLENIHASASEIFSGEGFRIETVAQDLRFTVRQLRKNPGFALTAILILALGMGVSVAIFGFVDAVLVFDSHPLKPLFLLRLHHEPADHVSLQGDKAGFRIDVRRIAAMPLNAEFFPDLDNTDHGIKGRSERLAETALKLFQEIASETPELIDFLGPEGLRKPIFGR